MATKLYEGYVQPVAGFASSLEYSWSLRFETWDWSVNYIGNECDAADFEVGGVRIEVKPDGDQFVQQAASRSGNILIAQGSPLWPSWWFVDYTGTAIRLSNGPCGVPGKSNTKPRVETVHEFMSRHGVRFE